MGIPPFSINQSSSHHGREDSCGSPGSCCRNIMQHPQLSSFPLLSWTVSASLLPTSVLPSSPGISTVSTVCSTCSSSSTLCSACSSAVCSGPCSSSVFSVPRSG